MRALVVSIWVFINLIFFGMCGYMYLLWSQYWMFTDKDLDATTSTYDQQIYLYNRGYQALNEIHHNKSELKNRMKHSLKENGTITLIRNSRPRFPHLQVFDFDKQYICEENDDCAKKTADFKDGLLKELRRVLKDESSVLKAGAENPYNVEFKGEKRDFLEKTQREVMCEFKKVELGILQKSDTKLGRNLRDYLPRNPFFNNKNFNSCAIVSSAGSLKDSKLGKLIDSHDLVLRFNNAPTKNYETDVGKKTTIRILNSQVVSKNEFRFLTSEMYKNVTLLVWDPSRYSSTINEWLEQPEFNFFPNYIEYRKRLRKSKFFIANPHYLWRLWDFIQNNTPRRLRRNPPSSGFLGLAVLLKFCEFVDLFEYIPSVRVSKKCHYYDVEENPACTFGIWHPLAAEKLLTYHLNIADDLTVFQKGFVRISGFRSFDC